MLIYWKFSFFFFWFYVLVLAAVLIFRKVSGWSVVWKNNTIHRCAATIFRENVEFPFFGKTVLFFFCIRLYFMRSSKRPLLSRLNASRLTELPWFERKTFNYKIGKYWNGQLNWAWRFLMRIKWFALNRIEDTTGRGIYLYTDISNW